MWPDFDLPAILAARSVLDASDHRRLFRGAIVSLIAVAAIWYPNWSALPLPTGTHNWYQGLLPTWIWTFQFGVTLAKPIDVPLAVFAAVRAGSLAVLRRLDESDVTRHGMHSERGAFSVADWLRIYGAHPTEHGRQIAKALLGER